MLKIMFADLYSERIQKASRASVMRYWLNVCQNIRLHLATLDAHSFNTGCHHQKMNGILDPFRGTDQRPRQRSRRDKSLSGAGLVANSGESTEVDAQGHPNGHSVASD
jgi:hypothetical protein